MNNYERPYHLMNKPYSLMTEAEREQRYQHLARERAQSGLICALAALLLLGGFMANVIAFAAR